MPVDFKLLSSVHNETFKQLARLIEQGRERRRQRLMVLEGFHLCQSALQAGVSIQQLFINDQALSHPELQGVLQGLTLTAGAQVFALASPLIARLTSLSSAPEVLAICARPEPQAQAMQASCILLETIQDPGNMGTLLRSAAAAGVTQLWLNAGCADVYAPKVLRAAMGAHFVLSLHEQADLPALLSGFDGVKLVTSLTGDRSLYAQDLRGSVAFVFGNEGTGVSAELQALADARVRIPMPGRAESLNVAMAATLCLFERVRQLEHRTSVRAGASDPR